MQVLRSACKCTSSIFSCKSNSQINKEVRPVDCFESRESISQADINIVYWLVETWRTEPPKVTRAADYAAWLCKGACTSICAYREGAGASSAPVMTA